MRRRATLVVTGVVVLLVVAGAVVSDLVLRSVVEQRLAASVRDSLGASGAEKVVVSTHRPLLLQLPGGRIDAVTVTADRVTLEQGAMTGVRIEATGVTIRRPYTAAGVTITGTVPIQTIRDRVAAKTPDVAVDVAGDVLRASGSVFGVPWGATLTPRADTGRLLVDLTAADVAGVPVDVATLPQAVRDALSGLDVPVTGLPAGLGLSAAHVVAAGVEVTATGRDVVLRG
jgi:hypothetical protein